MLKHIITIIALSAGIVLAMSYAQIIIQWIIMAHDHISNVLTDVFSAGQTGNIARGLLALLALPFLTAMVPTVLYWLVRRSWFPYFLQIVWVIWLLQAGALLVNSAA